MLRFGRKAWKVFCQNAETFVCQRVVRIITTLLWKVDSLWWSHPRLWRPRQQPAVLTVCSVALSAVTVLEKWTGRRKVSCWKCTWLLSLRRQKSEQTSFVLLSAHFVGQRYTTMWRLCCPHCELSMVRTFRVTERSRVHTSFDSCMMSYFFICSSAKFVTYRVKHSSKAPGKQFLKNIST